MRGVCWQGGRLKIHENARKATFSPIQQEWNYILTCSSMVHISSRRVRDKGKQQERERKVQSQLGTLQAITRELNLA